MRGCPRPACRQTSACVFWANRNAQLQPMGSTVRQARMGFPAARGSRPPALRCRGAGRARGGRPPARSSAPATGATGARRSSP
eukprot:13908195-Alexandrium_andersonii.AAC.1